MAILRRDDGTAFVLQPYRETLTIKNTSLLRKEIHYLAEMHGINMRLFKLNSGDYEAVFSPDVGYLLGETVWQKLERPDDMIYCEFYKNEQSFLVVIVREGKVYLDTKLPLDQLTEEISNLLTENTARYQVYTHGNVPVNFNLPAVKSNTVLANSLLTTIIPDEKLRLISVEAALAEYGLSQQRKKTSLLLLTTLCVIVLSGLWWYAQSQRTASTLPKVNPLEQYQLALATPAPIQQINALVKGLQKIDAISGWYPASFNYNGQLVQVPMRSLGGTATELLATAQASDMTADFSSNGASVNFVTILPGRATPDHIADKQQVIALVIDRMMEILPGKSVQINKSSSNQVFTQTIVTIKFSNIAPEILQLIGTRLNDLPVSLLNCTGDIKNGLFSGNLQIAVVGK